MKTLTVYYSRTGTTAKIAKEIAQKLKCDIEEIFDTKKRTGILRWFTAGADGSLKKTTIIKKVIKNPTDYDLVIVGTPIWVNTTPAIRTYLIENSKKFKKVAFFCTMGGTSGQKVFEEMEQITGKKPVATMDLQATRVQERDYQQTLQEYISKIK